MFYAYGLNEDGSVTSPKVYRVEFHTPLPEARECTFQFNYRPGINFGRVNVYPSDIHVSYIWGVMSKSEYNALPSDKAQAIVDKIKADMASQGGTWRDYVGYHNKFKITLILQMVRTMWLMRSVLTLQAYLPQLQ